MPIGVEDYTAARNRAPKAAERAPAHYRTWASFDPWKDNPGCTIRVAKRPSSLVKPPFMRPAMGIGTRIEGRLVPPCGFPTFGDLRGQRGIRFSAVIDGVTRAHKDLQVI